LFLGAIASGRGIETCFEALDPGLKISDLGGETLAT
jgi:hypothetical protein